MAAQAWCTTGDVKEQLGETLYNAFTDDVADPDDFVDDIIEVATGRARSYLLARYEELSDSWTTASVPIEVRHAVRDIVVYRLASHRINPTAPSPTIDTWRQSHDDAMKWLRAVSDGEALLDVEVVDAYRGGVRARIAGADRKPVF